MDLRQIQYFVALYEEKSITKAAKRLHVVQPAVSMQIRRIEVEYGAQLFERTTAGVHPNEAAAAIYPACLEVLNKVESIRRTLRDGSGKITGSLSVGVPPSIAHGILAEVLAAFTEKLPEVHLTISEGYSAHLVDWLLQGDLNFAILGEFDDDRRLYSQAIATDELVVVTSEETPHDGDSITGEQAATLKLVLPSSKNLIRILVDSEFEKEGIKVSPVMEVDSLATVFAVIRKPGWATILPSSGIGEGDLKSGFKLLRLTKPMIDRTLVAAFPTLKPSSAAAQEFIRVLRQVILRKSVSS
ncbi:MAG: LysR family transcriptional regulator [Rhizobiaceae bacterium]|nr:LysR family transcriptional regulator [Rhizobiaceae bacterium]